MKRIYFFLLVLMPLLLPAQESYIKGIQIKNSYFSLSKDKELVISLLFAIQSDVKVTSNSMLTITPVVVSNDLKQNVPLQSIYLCGRNRDIIMSRDRRINRQAYMLLRRQNNKIQNVNYLVKIPYESWMTSSKVKLLASMCGCANSQESSEEASLVRISFGNEESGLKPIVAFVTPAFEKVKNRNESARAYLSFPLNQTTLIPSFKKNNMEINNIITTIDKVKNEPNSTINSMEIIGYASPEGSYSNNKRLAEGRANALKGLIISKYSFPDNFVKSSSKEEDWDGLKAFIMKSNMKEAEGAKEIMNNKMLTNEERKKLLKADTAFYKILEDECFPLLRHSDYFINYSVRHFTVEEAKVILKTNPKLLSLSEMYQVAETYKIGSREFNEIFETAVLLFPTDKTANSNAAAAAIQRGDTERALYYIGRADKESAATINNMGAIMLLKGEKEKASELFEQAQEKGSAEATENIKLLSK